MDVGLLGGLTEGLKSGIESYRTERDYQDKKKAQAQEEAYKKALLDRQSKLDAIDIDKSGYQIDEAGKPIRSEGAIKQSAFDNALKRGGLLKEGVEIGQYDPSKGDFALSMKSAPVDSFKAQKQMAELDLLKSRKRNLDSEFKSGDQSLKKLAPEKKIAVEGLAKANVSKMNIKNQIDATLETLKNPKVSEDQKIAAGMNILKTLNSTEGADAVGAEEAKRLSSFLEYKLGNFTQPGSFIGRDLDMFTEQVGLKSGDIGRAIEANQAQIDEFKGGGGFLAAKPSKDVGPSGLLKEAAGTPKAMASDQRVINGVKYKKVKGGWEAVE